MVKFVALFRLVEENGQGLILSRAGELFQKHCYLFVQREVPLEGISPKENAHPAFLAAATRRRYFDPVAPAGLVLFIIGRFRSCREVRRADEGQNLSAVDTDFGCLVKEEGRVAWQRLLRLGKEHLPPSLENTPSMRAYAFFQFFKQTLACFPNGPISAARQFHRRNFREKALL